METSEILLWFFNGNFRNFALILQNLGSDLPEEKENCHMNTSDEKYTKQNLNSPHPHDDIS
jgi:hypothetical protein